MCTEVLSYQTPCDIQFALSVYDLDKSGMSRYNRLSAKEKMKAIICVLCKNRLKALKRRPTVGAPRGPKKKCAPKAVKVSSQILHEPRRLAAFQCQIFVFTQLEKVGKQQRDAMVCEQFYGYEAKNIKGACQQIIDGDNAFKFLYDVVEAETRSGFERVLKPMFRGKQTTCAFVAGVDITPAMVG